MGRQYRRKISLHPSACQLKRKPALVTLPPCQPPQLTSLLPSLRPLPAQNKPVFVTGMTGTGKTVTVQNLLSSLEPAEEDGGQNVVPMTVNFSAQTSSLVTQVRRVQRRAG